MDQKIKPAFQTQEYYAHEVIRCKDRFQQYIYVKNNVFPLDVYTSKGDMIMIFPKNETTKELYRKWRNREFHE